MDQRLWAEQLKAEFPASCRGRDVAGVDLALLDADTAGCLKTYFEAGTFLTLGHVAILGRCYHDLAVVRRELSGEARGYFQRLETLAGDVLAAASTIGFEA